MKNCKAILAALLLGACPAAWAQYSAGTNDLAQTNISRGLHRLHQRGRRRRRTRMRMFIWR